MQLTMTRQFKGGPLCPLLGLRLCNRFRAALQRILKTAISFESWTEIWKWANGERHLELCIFHPADAFMIGGTFFKRREETRHIPTILKAFPMRSIVVNYAQKAYLLLSVITPDDYIVLLSL